MKKTIVIVSIILVVCLGVVLGFKKIEKDREPFYANKEQFVERFKDNQEDFELVAGVLKEYEDVRYYYNSSQPSFETSPNISDESLQSAIEKLVNDAAINTIDKFKWGEIRIYQATPISGGHIDVGASYNYDENEWKYYYYHEYNSCHGEHNKIFYKLYDMIFNKETEIVLN